MQELTEVGKLAYVKVEELEQELKTIKNKVKTLEILYGTTPPPPDPDEQEDTPYVAPLPDEILTTGEDVNVPVYHQVSSSTSTLTFPYLFFTSHPNTTLILKLNLSLLFLTNPTPLTVSLFVDDVLTDSYMISNPSLNTYNVVFANAYVSSQIGHRIQYKIVAQATGCTYKVLNANYELIGTNITVLNPPKKYNVYYSNGIYYFSKCEQGYSNHLIQSASGINLDAPFTIHQMSAVEQQFAHSHQRINLVWQPTELGYFYKTGIGAGYMVNYNNTAKFVSISNSYGLDYLPNQSTSYGGVIIFSSNGTLYYYEILPDFSTRVNRTLESGVGYYVNVAGVKLLYDNINNATLTQKAKFVATRSDGSNVFFSAVTNFYKVELGFGTLISANYASETGDKIHVYLRAYNNIIKKVLTLNTTLNKYELTSETVIGTWDRYIEGFPPNYFTESDGVLTHRRGTI